MISKWTVKLLSFFWKFCYHLNIIHYYPKYDKVSGQLYLEKSKSTLKIFAVRASVILCAIYPLFVLYQIFHVKDKIPPDRRDRFVLAELYIFLAYLAGAIYQLNRWNKWDDILEFENNFLHLYKIRKHQSNNKVDSKGFKRCLGNNCSIKRRDLRKIFYRKPKSAGAGDINLKLKVYIIVPFIMGAAIILLNIILLFKKPQIPHFFISLICTSSKSCDAPLWYKTLLYLYDFWKLFIPYFSIQEMSIPCAYIYRKCAILLLRNHLECTTDDAERDRNIKVFLKLREYQYLQNLRHYCFRAVAQPTTIYLRKYAGAISLYCVIKFQDLSAMKMMCGTIIYFVKVYIEIQTAVDLCGVSEELIDNWSKGLAYKKTSNLYGNRKYLLKLVNSFQPLKTHVGDYFFYESGTWLETVNEIVDLVVSLLFM